jgi:DNA-binding CsgD family transcriptional regulator
MPAHLPMPRLWSLIEGWNSLSPAERIVAVHVVDGGSNKEIAQVLQRSEATIKNHVASILRRTNQPSRNRLIAVWHQAWIYAAEAGIVFPDVLPPSLVSSVLSSALAARAMTRYREESFDRRVRVVASCDV